MRQKILIRLISEEPHEESHQRQAGTRMQLLPANVSSKLASSAASGSAREQAAATLETDGGRSGGERSDGKDETQNRERQTQV